MVVVETIKHGYNLVMKNKIIFVPLLLLTIISGPLGFLILVGHTLGFEFVLFIIASILASILVRLMTINLCFAAVKSRKKISLQSSFSMATKKFLTLLGASLLYFAIVFGGILLLVIPGIYLAIRFSYYPYAILIDNKKAFESLTKSWKATKGRWWITFFTGLIVGLFTLIIIAPFYALGFFYPRTLSLFSIFISLISIFFEAWGIANFTILYLKFKK